jgi:hypothetical protein
MRRRENRGVTAAVGAQGHLRDVDRILVLGVGCHVLEDVDRLQRLTELAALLAQLPVDRLADRMRVLVPQVGEHVAHGTGHVVAILLVLVQRLYPDAVGIEQHELPHAAPHFGHPPVDVSLGGDGERPEECEHPIRPSAELHVGGVAGPCGQVRSKCRRARWIVETVQKTIERFRLQRGIELRGVFDRIGNTTEQVRSQHGAAQLAGQDPHTQCEGARDTRQQVAAPPLDLTADRVLDEVGQRFLRLTGVCRSPIRV